MRKHKTDLSGISKTGEVCRKSSTVINYGAKNHFLRVHLKPVNGGERLWYGFFTSERTKVNPK